MASRAPGSVITFPSHAHWGALSFKDLITEQSTILHETREECLPLHAGIIRNSWAVLRAYHNCTNQPSLICLQQSFERTPWLTFVYRPVNKMELRNLAILLVLSVVLHMAKSQGKRSLYIPMSFVREMCNIV